MNSAAPQTHPATGGSARDRAGTVHFFRINGFVLLAFIAGVFTPFSVGVVGQMPLGEVILFAAFFYAVVSVAMTHRWPNLLLAGRPFRVLMASQAIAFLAYIFSDLIRGSNPHDYARGWARMIFLAIDLMAMGFLAGTSRRCLVALIIGIAVGNCADTLLNGALFDDYWKFGFGGPITQFAVVGSAQLGLVATQLTMLILGGVHLTMDFRSLGAECILVASTLTMLRLRPQVRLWLLPILVVISLAGGAAFYQSKQEAGSSRSTRSNLERSAMMRAAWEAFVESPVLGHGSWFSNTNVMDHFLEIRTEYALQEGLGGFTTSEVEEGLALHSQILVALAEGGIFGAAFFFCYGIGLAWAIVRCAIFRQADQYSAVYLLALSAAVSNLFFSPFSGDHRVLIALSAAIVLQLWQERRTLAGADSEESEEEGDPETSSAGDLVSDS